MGFAGKGADGKILFHRRLRHKALPGVPGLKDRDAATAKQIEKALGKLSLYPEADGAAHPAQKADKTHSLTPFNCSIPVP